MDRDPRLTIKRGTMRLEVVDMYGKNRVIIRFELSGPSHGSYHCTQYLDVEELLGFHDLFKLALEECYQKQEARAKAREAQERRQAALEACPELLAELGAAQRDIEYLRARNERLQNESERLGHELREAQRAIPDQQTLQLPPPNKDNEVTH